LTADLDY